MMDSLSLFSNITRQVINYEKSGVIFEKRIPNKHQKILQIILKIRTITTKDTYLGAPLFLGQSKTVLFQHILDRNTSKINGWKTRLLSQAGITVLIKSVTSTIPPYQMACFLLPKNITTALNNLQRDFWWGRNQTKT